MVYWVDGVISLTLLLVVPMYLMPLPFGIFLCDSCYTTFLSVNVFNVYWSLFRLSSDVFEFFVSRSYIHLKFLVYYFYYFFLSQSVYSLSSHDLRLCCIIFLYLLVRCTHILCPFNILLFIFPYQLFYAGDIPFFFYIV